MDGYAIGGFERNASFVGFYDVARNLIVAGPFFTTVAAEQSDAAAISANFVADDEVVMGMLDGDSVEEIVLDDVADDSVLVGKAQPHSVAAVAGDVADEDVASREG